MNHYIEFTIISFTSLFVIIDPIGLIPSFLALTLHQSNTEKINTARLATGLTFAILFLTIWIGQWILKMFNITLPAFEIAGGLILLLVGMDMVQARRTSVKETREEQQEGLGKEDVAVTPLAVPMLAGPGAITTVILLISRSQSVMHCILLAINLAVIATITYFILRTVSIKANFISVIGIKIMTRLMGLILAAIAVQFIINGIASSKIFV